jgi:hypothetical protein
MVEVVVVLVLAVFPLVDAKFLIVIETLSVVD